MICEHKDDCHSSICKELGCLRFTLNSLPISKKASPKEKNEFKDLIGSLISETPCIFLSDIKISISIWCSEEERYETDGSPDLDNILKPLLDALCGQQGIMVDDCQVQSLEISWLSIDHKAYTVVEILDIHQDVLFQKKDLFFLKFFKGLCFPCRKSMPPW